MPSSVQSSWRSWKTFMRMLDLQNGKMPFCPVGFVLVDHHISEVKYETRIEAFDCKKPNFTALYS